MLRLLVSLAALGVVAREAFVGLTRQAPPPPRSRVAMQVKRNRQLFNIWHDQKPRWIEELRNKGGIRKLQAGGSKKDMIEIYRKKAEGFWPDEQKRSKSDEMTPLFRMRMQQDRFWEHSQNRHSLSQVFFRYEGKTPWKPVGEVVSSIGDFEEAVISQWPLILRWAHHIWRKMAFWSVTGNQVQIGYTDFDGNIVPVSGQKVPEYLEPVDLKDMLIRSGFNKGDWHPDFKPKGVSLEELRPRTNAGRPARLDEKWWAWRYNAIAKGMWNKDKYKGQFRQIQEYKRGRVMGPVNFKAPKGTQTTNYFAPKKGKNARYASRR